MRTRGFLTRREALVIIRAVGASEKLEILWLQHEGDATHDGA